MTKKTVEISRHCIFKYITNSVLLSTEKICSNKHNALHSST